ncbi:MAG: T9SS type A sorting domain-containing protein [Bacteroidetes bacterium]|nr:T9SS type A sorting domain-containing protein [Bacteroidota bacterium]
MKNILLAGLALLPGLTVMAQRPQIRKDIYTRNYQKEQPVIIEPVEKVSVSPCTSRYPGLKNGDNPGIVTVLDLGTSANVLGYSHGTRTMLWADDDLNVVANIHRMGPGAIPASLSGYLAIDLGKNMGQAQSDWTPQIQVCAATLAASPNYYDACRYPSAGLFNPAGNLILANTFLAYFAPNYANLAGNDLGGYGYGTANLVNHADTTRHLRWYNAHPCTYVPDGFTIAGNGIAHMVDLDMKILSGVPVYQDSIIYGRGVWNAATKDFDYTFTTLAFPVRDDNPAADCKVAVSPDGSDVWISVLSNPAIGNPLIDSTYYPVLRNSQDGGLTWGDPKVVQLDGPNGIAAIKQQYSDYFIEHFFTPPVPSRDEIPYTTAFDHSLSIDKWGNPHIGVAVGFAPGSYAITTGVDSLINVFDIYTVNHGGNFQGKFLGSLKTFRGTWAGNTCDNRVYVTRNKVGTKMFFTWNDTRIDGIVNNQNPDVWARGFDLSYYRTTLEYGQNAPRNVTYSSAVAHEAYWQCTSPLIFTDNGKYTIPICTQWFSDASADSKFKYISDFSFKDSDFTFTGMNMEYANQIQMRIYPNPVNDIANIFIDLKQNSQVSLELKNLAGTIVMSFNKGLMSAGPGKFSVDVSSLVAGVYFVTLCADEERYPIKMIVK